MPWLPQTLLVPVRQRDVDRDEPRAVARRLAGARNAFTAANPDVGLHHMHDANQDRLMIRRMAYFRFKYRRLPAGYAEFLRACLAPGGTVVAVECGEMWPTASVGERAVFQHGAVGGATVSEYARGGPRVARFLTEQGSSRRAWDPPPADGESPEAEWGFEPSLLEDLGRICAARGWRLQRLRFAHPDTLSGPVAETYRAWYVENGVSADRLLVDCFALLDVALPLRLGLVPYWTTFGTRTARDGLLGHLRRAPAYDEVHIGLFSHGTCSIGWARVSDWDEVLRCTRRGGGYLGVDREVYPQDFASNLRFHRELAALSGGAPAPHPAPWPWVAERIRAFDAGH